MSEHRERRAVAPLGVAMVLCLVFGAQASAQFFVGPSGVDVPPPAGGTPDNPFRTITYGVTWASGGAVTLILQPGFYGEATGESFPIVVPPNTRIAAEVPCTATIQTSPSMVLPSAFVVPAGSATLRMDGVILGARARRSARDSSSARLRSRSSSGRSP